jgi:hypothetical protein
MISIVLSPYGVFLLSEYVIPSGIPLAVAFSERNIVIARSVFCDEAICEFQEIVPLKSGTLAMTVS